MKSFFLLTALLVASPVMATVVFHEVDVQLTFWEQSGKHVAGPLAVPGSKALEKTIAQIKRKAYRDSRVKAVASMDWHQEYEVEHPEIFPEFQQFGAHGMGGQSGEVGADRIPQVLVYPLEKVYYVEHHRLTDGDWKVIPQVLDVAKIKSNDYEVVIHKNGIGSYSVFSNERTDEVYKLIAPKAVFVYGVATDFCVHAAVMGLIERGYKTYVIEDAIAGIFPEGIQEKTEEMKKAGAIFVKYKDVPGMIGKLNR